MSHVMPPPLNIWRWCWRPFQQTTPSTHTFVIPGSTRPITYFTCYDFSWFFWGNFIQPLGLGPHRRWAPTNFRAVHDDEVLTQSRCKATTMSCQLRTQWYGGSNIIFLCSLRRQGHGKISELKEIIKEVLKVASGLTQSLFIIPTHCIDFLDVPGTWPSGWLWEKKGKQGPNPFNIEGWYSQRGHQIQSKNCLISFITTMSLIFLY